jgi:hypothetical protein
MKEKDFNWYITVHRSFMINITVHQAYVPYTDQCTSHHLDFMEGHSSTVTLLARFCGHSHREVVYTKGNKALVRMNHSVESVFLAAIYQVHIKGYAFRFHNTYLLFPPAWNVHIPHQPAFVVYVRNTYQLTWFYTKPIITFWPNEEECYSTFNLRGNAIPSLCYGTIWCFL